MTNSLSKGYATHTEITNKLKEAKENENAYGITKQAQKFLTVATTLIYYSFTSVIFAGVSVWGFQSYAFGNATNINGLVFTIALVISAPIGLALAKHTNFSAMAKARDLSTLVIRLLILLAVLTGVWYEAISSSSNLQEKAFHAVENGKTGESILNSGITITAGNNPALAKAEFQLVSCERKLSEGSVKDCRNSAAAVKSLKEQAALDRKALSEANVSAITAKQAAIDKERDSHVLPAAKAIAEGFGTSLAAGTFIVVVVSSFFFELIHLSTVFSERGNLAKRYELDNALQALKLEYFRMVGKPYSPLDFKDDRIIDLSSSELTTQANAPITESEDKSQYEIRVKGTPFQDKPPIGFVRESASENKFKWQNEADKPEKTRVGFGFIHTPSPVKEYDQTIVMPTAERGVYTDVPRLHANNPLESTANTVRVSTREIGVSTREIGVSTHEPVYTRFSAIPTYEEGLCKWCGMDLKAFRKGTKFCKEDHKDKYWNLYKPANRRLRREL
jgi:hypothetical protein